jgi:pimeloyl-ACP methyl ester carboxylesterase
VTQPSTATPLARDLTAPGHPRLAARVWSPGEPTPPVDPVAAQAGSPPRPFLLVHGLASNARLWDGVGRRLAATGHQAVAVDQRGHGRSEVPDSGYDTDTCADDLAAVIDLLGWTGPRAPVVAGQSWGGNVVLSLAARHPGSVAGVCCVDGGWIRLADRFPDAEACWQALAPPSFDGLRYDDLAERIRQANPHWPEEGLAGTLANLVRTADGGVRARLSREHHRSIVDSLYRGDPRRWYPAIEVPVLLCPATAAAPDARPDADQRAAITRAAVLEALAALPDGGVRWYPGAHHDIHAEQPDPVAADLLDLAGSVRSLPGGLR